MDKDLWEKAVAFHGHECPGLAIGFKACEAAREKMRIGTSDDEQIVCVTENDACGVDAVQALLSCTLGKGNLIYRGTGKQAFSFFDRTNGKKLRVCLISGKNSDMDRIQWKEFLLSSPVDEIFLFPNLRLIFRKGHEFSLPWFARFAEKVLLSTKCTCRKVKLYVLIVLRAIEEDGDHHLP